VNVIFTPELIAEHRRIAAEVNAGKWTEYEDDDGTVGIQSDADHIIVIGNLEGSCRTCHLIQQYGPIAANNYPAALAEIARLRQGLTAAHNALLSYQYGNGSPGLAREVAQFVEKALKGEGK
jgi:hypothetical protein